MSSHREAPEISKDPCADNTDVYAFVSPDAPDTVTLIANFLPFELPYGGPNFAELLRRTSAGTLPDLRSEPSSPHGTTIAALRYSGGVIMAGDRRATEGVTIAYRNMEKVFPADR